MHGFSRNPPKSISFVVHRPPKELFTISDSQIELGRRTGGVVYNQSKDFGRLPSTNRRGCGSKALGDVFRRISEITGHVQRYPLVCDRISQISECVDSVGEESLANQGVA